MNNEFFSLRFHSPTIESPEPSNLPSEHYTHCRTEVNDSHCAPSEFLIHKIHGNSKWLLEATKTGANLFLNNGKQNGETTNLIVYTYRVCSQAFSASAGTCKWLKEIFLYEDLTRRIFQIPSVKLGA